MYCRAAQIALVSKSWRDVEKRNAHQPLELQLQTTEIEHSFLNWNLRDTSRLEVVGMMEMPPLYSASTAPQIRSYWSCVHQLLVHLTIEAPALRSLEVILYNYCRLENGTEDRVVSRPPFRVLPLIGFMTQLRSLTLCLWEMIPEDIPLISQLSNLQNLEVTSPFWVSACFTPLQ
jgi:hypothetical protein